MSLQSLRKIDPQSVTGLKWTKAGKPFFFVNKLKRKQNMSDEL